MYVCYLVTAQNGCAERLEAHMRLSNSAHEARAWRIREIAPDFRLEDVWALPVRGEIGDFATLLDVMSSLDLSRGRSRATRALFRIRWRVGEWFGWDEQRGVLPVPGNTEASLSDRLPEDLRGTATDAGSTPFTPLFRTDVEWAAELSNRTVHAVMHLAWVDAADGLYQGQMAVYVKPRGRFGAAYMAAIAPFRHRVVYPALMREIERAWNARVAQAPA
jgi:hypothetical protein